MAISRRLFLTVSASTIGVGGYSLWATPLVIRRVHVVKSPSCGCCSAWISHLRAAGFTVDALHDEEALRQLKDEYDVPEALRSCHTATVAGYVLEGHVPASDVERLLAERPEGTGLAVAGMPLGSPGMEMGGRREPFDVVLFGPQGSTLFSRHR